MPSNTPADAPTPYSDPIILYGQAVVSPSSGGAPNTDALSNPDDLDMELLEVRWRIYPSPTDAASAAGLGQVVEGLAIGVKMDLGAIPVVDSDVPVAAFGNARDIDDSPTSNTLSYGIYPDPTDVNAQAIPFSYRWRLKYPLFIPGGAVLTPVYANLGQVQFPVFIDTVYVCRQRPSGQRRSDTIKAPWVGSYNSAPFDNVGAQAGGQDFSSESDLFNPFSVPLEITRLSGSCAEVLQTGSVIEHFGAHRFLLGNLRARSKRGGELARLATPFNTLFPIEWRVWDIPGRWHMMPGEYYKLQLNVSPVVGTPLPVGSIQYMVSAVGFRDIPLQDFMTAAFAEPENGE